MSKGMSLTDEAEKNGQVPGEVAGAQTVANRRHAPGLPLPAVLEGVELHSELPSGPMRIAQVAYDSRKVQPGALFVAIPGVSTDGKLFAKDAVSRGATVILSEQP